MIGSGWQELMINGAKVLHYFENELRINLDLQPFKNFDEYQMQMMKREIRSLMSGS